jgi:hypothetical protein
MITVKQWIITPKFKLHYEAKLPGKREVCGRCNGDGKICNPNIGPLTEGDMDLMDVGEFYLNLKQGVYDVRCPECSGNKVVDVLDWDALSPKMQKAVERAVDEQRRDDAEAAAERRWGA